ncbi:nucleoside 2-deoxyribosyltransferase [Halobacteriales archaeon QH_10_67_13]|nr:MAG: nucleoside 2-deoxyribosyltransferase [Halobacteriales archaeon QH_10_67_13]
MELYFCGSIRGGRDDASLYAELIEELSTHGTVLTEHVGTAEPEEDLADGEIHDRDVEWLRAADAVVAEVTTPSLGVGYELGRAVAAGTPTLALYRPTGEHELSAMIRGAGDIEVVEYTEIAVAADAMADFLS